MAFARVRDPETKKLITDKASVIYSSRIALTGIPEAAHRYQLGSRWPSSGYSTATKSNR
jgi:predicted helicase